MAGGQIYAYLTVGVYVLNTVWHEHGLGNRGSLSSNKIPSQQQQR